MEPYSGAFGDFLIIIGMTSVMLLWVFSLVGVMHAAWDTLGEHALTLIDKLRGKG